MTEDEPSPSVLAEERGYFGEQKLVDAIADVDRSIQALRAALDKVRDALKLPGGGDHGEARMWVRLMEDEEERLRSAREGLAHMLAVQPQEPVRPGDWER